MRLVCIILALALAAPLLSPADALAPQAGTERAERRAELLDRLRSARTETAAREAEDAIWKFWMQAPDARAQEMLDKALERRRWYDYAGALEHLNKLVAAYPDYAEGWNQRATIHFLREDYAASLADIEETLAREPAHFGALAGKAVILMRRGETAEGQLALIEAMKIDPWLKERALLLPGTEL